MICIWSLDQLHQFINQALLGVFSILDIWVKINRIHKISLRNLRQNTLVPEAFFYSFLANFATRTASFRYFFIATKRWEARKESLWSRPLGTSLSCHQLLTVVSDWRIFLITPRVIWLAGLNIFGDGSGVSMFTFMGRCGELLLYDGFTYQGRVRFPLKLKVL